MPVMRYREALNQALREEMEADENVFLMGEDIGVYGGAFKVTDGFIELADRWRRMKPRCSSGVIVRPPIASSPKLSTPDS